MNFDSYTDQGAEAAAQLVNQLSPGWDRGRPKSLPTGEAERRRSAADAEMAVWGRSGHLGPEDAAGLYRLAGRLRLVFETASQGEADATAGLVNSLLREYRAAPQLATHDGESWHLHFHSQEQEAGRASARGATCATALAVVVGSGGLGRLGVCAAPRCDRVFVDTSKNGSRRFCSGRCLSREKVAQFRARRGAGAGG